jgi:hypothetical protein
MAGTSISDAFSGIRSSTLAALLEDFSLAADSPVAGLLSLGITGSDALDAIAGYIISSAPGLRLYQIVPVLRRDSQMPLQLDAFPTRPANALQKNGVSTWQQLLDMTPTDVSIQP